MDSKSPKARLRDLGAFLQHERLAQNMSQEQVAELAGISRRTVVLMEGGEGGTIKSLLGILYALGREDIWEQFKIVDVPQPLVLAKIEKARRKRATGSRGAADLWKA